MLLKTYTKLLDFFKSNHGYANFSELRAHLFTMTQINELEKEGIIEHFSRGWYWCNECGFSKPDDYKYIEIAKVNPKSIICLESACYLNGLINVEPKLINVATLRSDRKKMNFNFPIQRHYYTNFFDEHLQEQCTEFGNYYFFSKERTIYDCIRMNGKISPECHLMIEQISINEPAILQRFKNYSAKFTATQKGQL